MIRASSNDHNDRKIVSVVPHPASVGQQFPKDFREQHPVFGYLYQHVIEMIKITIKNKERSVPVSLFEGEGIFQALKVIVQKCFTSLALQDVQIIND